MVEEAQQRRLETPTAAADPLVELFGPISPGASVRPSRNILHRPAVYELENNAVDRSRLIEAAMRDRADWAGGDLLDIGCGTGFHLPRYATTAATVTGVEPHPPLAAIARRRTRRTANVSVLEAPSS